jgi:putative membrane protein
MSYELLEWIYAAYGGNPQAGADFLGSQGDIWDAQKDMLMDTLGAVASLALFLVLRRRVPETTSEPAATAGAAV